MCLGSSTPAATNTVVPTDRYYNGNVFDEKPVEVEETDTIKRDNGKTKEDRNAAMKSGMSISGKSDGSLNSYSDKKRTGSLSI